MANFNDLLKNFISSPGSSVMMTPEEAEYQRLKKEDPSAFEPAT